MTTEEIRAKLQSARQKCTDVFRSPDAPESVWAPVREARAALERALEAIGAPRRPQE